VPALTARERRVLQLIAEGRTTKEIAADLGGPIENGPGPSEELDGQAGNSQQTDLVRYAVREGILKL